MARKKKEPKARPMLKACLVANRYRAREFGQLVGLSEQAISGIITGRRAVSRREMAVICQALGTPAKFLFPGESAS